MHFFEPFANFFHISIGQFDYSLVAQLMVFRVQISEVLMEVHGYAHLDVMLAEFFHPRREFFV